MRVNQQNRQPDTEALVSRGDVLLLGGSDANTLEIARASLGERVHDHVITDRRQLDLLRAFVSAPDSVADELPNCASPAAPTSASRSFNAAIPSCSSRRT